MSSSDSLYALSRAFAAVAEEERDLLRDALFEKTGRGRERYAAWLRERGDPRGEALALDRALRDADDPAAASRLRELLPALDRDWWWVMRQVELRNCGARRGAPPRVRFRVLCERSWAALEPTGDAEVRACDRCQERVYRCATGEEAAARARRGQCIAVDPAMVADEATDGRGVFLGRPDYLAMWAAKVFPDDDRER
ncbi:MAG: hypothetical protein R3A79_12670 [Nannocystaceae bacterium]